MGQNWLIEECSYQVTPLDDIFEIRLRQLHQLLDYDLIYSSYAYEMNQLMQNKNVNNLWQSPGSMTQSCTLNFNFDNNCNTMKDKEDHNQDLGLNDNISSDIHMPYEVIFAILIVLIIF